jgi:EAL domain-containing protein (putative c-di-GMP-specific phosphodiesterase class I)
MQTTIKMPEARVRALVEVSRELDDEVAKVANEPVVVVVAIEEAAVATARVADLATTCITTRVTTPIPTVTVPVVSMHIPSLEIPMVDTRRTRDLSPISLVAPPSTPTIIEASIESSPIASGVRMTRRSTLPASMHTKTVDRALASMRVDLEPIFDANALRVIGHEARIVWQETNADGTTKSANLVERPDVRLQRRMRDLAVAAFTNAATLSRHNQRGLLFVDVFPHDLLDPELFRQDSPIARMADKVVLQLRGPMGIVMEDLSARISVLRFQGYRFAVADIESTPSRLSLLAEISPEYIKLDESITRGVSESSAKRRVIEGLVMMSALLNATPIGEGVSNVEDRAALAEAGCPLVQGPLHSDDLAQPVQKPRARTERIDHRRPILKAPQQPKQQQLKRVASGR